MPDSPLTAPRPVADLESALTVLRENGGRVSTSRQALLRVMFDAEGPLPVERIASAAVPSLDVPSGLYELARAGERDYAWCESCGKAVSLAPDALDEARDVIERTIGYRPRFGHFPMVCLCSECLARGASPDR